MFMQFLTYLFWPNPGNATYSDPNVLPLLVVSLALILLSFVVRLWRRNQSEGLLRKLSKSWAAALLWFGVVGVVLVVCRVENIQFLAMRVLWVVWAAVILAYIYLQFRLFRMRYYQIIPTARADDPRAKYLPQRKR